MNARKIAITGAAGNIGAKLRTYLQDQSVELLLLDRHPRGDPEIIAADLSRYQTSWMSLLVGVEVLVHLAASPMADAPWDRLEPDNVDATLNVLHAALTQGVSRVVLASSVQAAIGKVGRQTLIDGRGSGAPVNFYGATKCVGERLGEHYARQFGMSVIALRLGWVQPGENLPGIHLGSISDQQLWLSNRDLCRGIAGAISAPGIGFGVFNLLSDNQGMPWDLTETVRVLGWTPLDRYTPQIPPLAPVVTAPQRVRGRLPKLMHGLKRRLFDIFFW